MKMRTRVFEEAEQFGRQVNWVARMSILIRIEFDLAGSLGTDGSVISKTISIFSALRGKHG